MIYRYALCVELRMSAGLLLSDILRNPRQFPSSDDLIFLSPCGILWHLMTEHDGKIHGPQLKAESRFLLHWELLNLYIHNSDLSRWSMHGPQSGMRSQLTSAGSFLSRRYSDHQNHCGEDWFTSIPDCLCITDASQWEPTLETENNGVRQVWDLLGYLFPGKSCKPSLPCFSDGGIIGIHVDVWEPMFHTQQQFIMAYVVSVACNNEL